ncbi:MAG: S41 family peptidase [Bacteroidota bacterium]
MSKNTMKSTLFLGLAVLFCCSAKAAPALSSAQIEAYTSIGRVWGFLKYHHPTVRSGALNWDRTLMKAFEEYEDSPPPLMCQQVISKLLSAAGPVDECDVCFDHLDKEEKGISIVNWQWMKPTPFLTEAHVTSLRRIRDQRAVHDSTQHAYLQQWYTVSRRFVMDSAYEDLSLFTPQQRLLALYHYWNVIVYFFPYRTTANPNWAQVLHDFIPRFWEAKGERAFQYAMWELANQINDGHGGGGSPYLSAHGYGKYWLPFWARLSAERRVFITELRNDSLGQAVGLKVGDEILQVNGRGIRELLAEKGSYKAASNATTKDLYCLWAILQDTLPMATLKLTRGSATFDLVVPRYLAGDLKANRHPKWYWADTMRTVLVARAHNMRSIQDARAFLKKSKRAEAIVIDFRMGSMGDEARYLMIQRMLPKNEPINITAFPLYAIPGNWEKLVTQSVYGRQAKSWRNKPLVLLSGEYNISKDEWAIMCFQTSSQAYTIGRPTGGALSYMAQIQMPGQFNAAFTMGYMAYPDGSPIFGPGVKLDERVEPTAAQLSQGRDPALEHALQYLSSPIEQP